MAIPFVLMAAGTALQVFGNYQANMAQAKAEIANAEFYREQANFAFDAGLREAQIARTKYSSAVGAQRSAYARGGVDISGSAAGVIANTMASKYEELAAISKKRDLDYRLAMLRGTQAAETGATLSSPGYNLTQAGSTVLTNLARSYDNGRSPTFGTAQQTSSSLSGGSGYLGTSTKFDY